MLSGMPCVTTWNRLVCQDPQLDQIPFLFRNESCQKGSVIEVAQPALVHRCAGFHIDRPPYPGVEGQIKKERSHSQALFRTVSEEAGYRDSDCDHPPDGRSPERKMARLHLWSRAISKKDMKFFEEFREQRTREHGTEPKIGFI